MYTQFFGLKQEPFSIAPDPRYLFMSERHREALAHLLYGVGSGGGFVLLSGEIGAGKTTVCRCFLEQIPKKTNVAYIFNPKLTVIELLQSVCEEFRVPVAYENPASPTVKDFIDPLNRFLLKTHAVGQNNLLIIDEAQNLSADVLEQLRLLTNLETNERKLLQIVLIGQPELRAMLDRPELEQLAQRVIARFHLEALSVRETSQYIRHRLAVAGITRSLPFDRRAMQRIHQVSRGVPRRINLLCDRALLGAYARGKSSVDTRMVDKAAREVFGHSSSRRIPRMSRRRAAYAGIGMVVAAGLFGTVAFTMSSVIRGSGGSGAARATSAPVATSGAASGVASALAAASAASQPEAIGPADFASVFTPVWRDEDAAWRALAADWKLQLDSGDACDQAARQGVQCYRANAITLAEIRQLARPGIVTLRDDQGGRAYALLSAVDDRVATLRMGTVTRTLPLASLAALWTGDFATLWRVPPGYANHLVADPSDPLADWLSAQLASVQGGREPGASGLKAQIAAFQVAQGLKADGLAGPTTFMQLNRALGIDEPRLADRLSSH